MSHAAIQVVPPATINPVNPSHSRLARIQQVATMALVAGAALWMRLHWNGSRWTLVLGSLLILFSSSAFLAIEFVTLRLVNRGDPTPLANWRQLLYAWARETVQALRVFSWRQPFAWRAVADQLRPADSMREQRGIVFLHGFVCNRGFWTPWMKLLGREKRAFVAVNLEPVFGSIDEYVPAIDQAVAALTDATGKAPALVCHSMGGLAARAWLRAPANRGRVHRVITIGTPHHGTWLAPLVLQEIHSRFPVLTNNVTIVSPGLDAFVV